MAEEERTEEQIATPPEGTAETPETPAAPAGPTLEELQAKVAEYETKMRELDGHRRGQAQTITNLSRRLNDFSSLKADIRETKEAIRALAKVSLADEPTESLPPSRLQQFEAQINPPAPSGAPQQTQAQMDAAERINTLLSEADIDSKAIPDDLKEAMGEAGDFWQANITGRAVRVIEKALAARKVTKETETMNKKEADDQKERERKAASLRSDHSSSQGSSLNSNSYEALSKMRVDDMTPEQGEKLLWLQNQRLRDGKPL